MLNCYQPISGLVSGLVYFFIFGGRMLLIGTRPGILNSGPEGVEGGGQPALR